LLWGQFIRLLSDKLLSNKLLSDIWHLPGNSRLPAAEPCMDCVWWLVLWLQCHFSTVGRVRNLGVWERPKNVASKMLHWFQNLFLPCWGDSDKFAKKSASSRLRTKIVAIRIKYCFNSVNLHMYTAHNATMNVTLKSIIIWLIHNKSTSTQLWQVSYENSTSMLIKQLCTDLKDLLNHVNG